MRSNIVGRVIGGILITAAVGWILQLAGAFNWRNTGTSNQLFADQPPVTDPAAFAARTPGTPGSTTPGRTQTLTVPPNARPDGSAIAQNGSQTQIPGDSTTGTTGTTGGTASAPLNGGTGSVGDVSGAPVVRAGW